MMKWVVIKFDKEFGVVDTVIGDFDHMGSANQFADKKNRASENWDGDSVLYDYYAVEKTSP
jgi:hypothetical protein